MSSKINGTVYALLKNPGEIVTTIQPLASIGSADNFVNDMLVDEVDIVKLKIGQPVLLTLDAYVGHVFSSRLSKIYPEKDERNQTFLVEAIFDEQPKVLYPGLSGEANILFVSKRFGFGHPQGVSHSSNKVKTENGFINVRTGLESIDSQLNLSGLTPDYKIYKPKENNEGVRYFWRSQEHICSAS